MNNLNNFIFTPPIPNPIQISSRVWENLKLTLPPNYAFTLVLSTDKTLITTGSLENFCARMNGRELVSLERQNLYRQAYTILKSIPMFIRRHVDTVTTGHCVHHTSPHMYVARLFEQVYRQPKHISKPYARTELSFTF
jgi:hypothetical protein